MATLMALVLLQSKGTRLNSNPKFLRVAIIQSSWEQQVAAATYSTSVVDWATLDCLREDQDTREDTKKLISLQSGLPLNMTPSIIRIGIPAKRKRGGGQKPKTELRCETKVPEDPLDGLTMRHARRRLKARAQADCELDVRSRHR